MTVRTGRGAVRGAGSAHTQLGSVGVCGFIVRIGKSKEEDNGLCSETQHVKVQRNTLYTARCRAAITPKQQQRIMI